jgi:hypothetical protein
MKFALACVATALLAAAAHAALGGDMASPVSAATFSCLKQNNSWEFMIVRSYHSYGAPDSNAGPTLAAAKAAGIEGDVYHFPCQSQSAAGQIKTDVDAVGKGNFGTMWLDIEYNPSGSCGWSKDLGANCRFLQALVDAAQGMGVHVGVYSSHYEWGLTMGAGCKAGSGAPLWFARYNGVATNYGFTSLPFGGWSGAVAHQYADHISTPCGASADADYRDAAALAQDRKLFRHKFNVTQ